MKIGARRSWLLLALLFSIQLWAIPKPEKTNLPVPTDLKDGDKELLYEALQLQVYQDAEKPEKYYYVPPFHFKQYRGGVTNLTANDSHVENYAQAKSALRELNVYRQMYTREHLEELNRSINETKDRVEKARDKLTTAIESGNQQLISMRKDALEEELKELLQTQQELEKAKVSLKENSHILPPGMGRSYFDIAVHHIVLMGGSFAQIDTSQDPKLVENALHNRLSEVAGGNGGFMSANVYAGFTKKQRESLSAYRTKFFPNIKISLLPLDELSFEPLTEWQKDPQRKNSELTSMIGKIKGAGDYLGIALNIDAIVMGASALAARLGPFIPPLAIKGKFKQKIHPVEASLVCDFGNGFEVKGRADIRDGAIIYDNNITNTIKGEDLAKGACDLKIESGDINSAYIKGLQFIEQEFEKIKFKRTQLSREEKTEYLKKVEGDLDNNRRKGGSGYGGILAGIPGIGLISYFLPAVARTADFHWHTNIQDVQRISTVKFTKKISVKGHETIERSMPVSLCLIYNQKIKAYERCTAEEENEAVTMPQSATQALQSADCENIINPFECGQLRGERGRIPSREVMPWARDDETPMNL